MQFVNEDSYVYCGITGVIYGLAQAGQIVHPAPCDGIISI